MEFLSLIYVGSIILLTLWGKNKIIGASGAFLWSLLLTPLVGFFIVAFSKERKWKCDFCGYSQHENFEICPKCKRDSFGKSDEDRLRIEVENDISREKIKQEIIEGKPIEEVFVSSNQSETSTKVNLVKENRNYLKWIIFSIIFIFLTLPFHYVPSRLKVFPKNNLSFNYTIVTENDITKIINMYNNASLFQKQAINNEPLVRKLMEHGIIEEKK
jgi:hypothetical protein